MNFPKITVSDMHSIDGHFYILGWWDNGLGLYKLEKPGTLFLDYNITGTVASNGEVDLSTWAFKDVDLDDIEAVCITGEYEGMRVQIESLINDVLVLKEKTLFNGEDLTIGVKFTSTYIPTMPVLRDKDGKAWQLVWLQVNFVEATVAKTVGFKVYMTAPYYEETVQEFSGINLGSSFVVGHRAPSDRKEYISVGHDARAVQLRFEVDSYSDLIIQSLEYKGTYTQRGQRM